MFIFELKISIRLSYPMMMIETNVVKNKLIGLFVIYSSRDLYDDDDDNRTRRQSLFIHSFTNDN
ncbi:hypothetical protein DERP_000150 [Dermatophagoides pteronyssinus]|uniref:Uncharacterized protein n=1 Tax=Dermatophagoides pteronyssinus TaxID=6956 RepID=A0ABQ8IZF9_DERPT|nr:hypothetical protein DERP_000150 [Dermatophagoides pteronyssinus]